MKSNAADVFRVLLERVEGVQDDLVARACAVAVMPEMKQRIHVEGRDSSGAPIGTYSNEYMKLRTGNYQNAGKNNSGFYTKGKNAIFDVSSKKAIKVKKSKDGTTSGSLRQNYNRTADTKVILSLTRQMENDWGVVEGTTSYGLGFKNATNYKKSIWCEDTYKKPIYQLTQQELQLVRDVAKSFADQITGKE